MQAERTIKKHVAIIHAHSLMSSLQRKIVNALLYEANVEKNRVNSIDSVAIESRISFSSIAKKVSFNSNNTQYLKEAIDGLASLKIEWNLLKDKVPTNISFLNLRVLHGPPTFYQDGTLNYSFHKLMLDLVNNPAIYGIIDLDLQSKFESKYGHALYENSTRFISLHKNKIIQLETFRKLLGVREDKYDSMRELTRNVVKPSVEEVNERADFIVKLEPIKIGRKVTSFELFVETKKPKQLKNKIHFDQRNVVFKEIKAIFETLNDSILENIIENYPEEYIFEKLAYTKKYAKKDAFGKYPIPYFISALKYDYKANENNLCSSSDEPGVITQEALWQEKWFNLQADLDHWKRQLEYAQTSHKETLVGNVHKVIAESEEKLKQHLLERPISNSETV